MYDAKVIIDPVLTGIAAEYKNDDYVTDKLFKRVTVKQQSGKYFVLPPRIVVKGKEKDYRAAGTVANEIKGGVLSEGNFYCTEHALQTPVTEEERRNHAGSPLKPDADATRLVTDRVLLNREVELMDLVLDDTKYASGHSKTLTGTAKWSDATSNPRKDVKEAMLVIHKKSGITPNTIVMGYETYVTLEEHPDIVARFASTSEKYVEASDIAKYLGVQNVIVSKALSGTGTGMDVIGSGYIWKDSVVLCYVNNGNSEPTFGSEILWGSPTVDRWKEAPRKSDIIRYTRSYDLKLTGIAHGTADKGKLITAFLFEDVL